MDNDIINRQRSQARLYRRIKKENREARVGHVHDIITGGAEGGAGVLALEPLLQKFSGKPIENPFRGGLAGTAKRVGAAAAIGAGATGLIGALVSAGSKKSRDRAQKARLSHDLDRVNRFLVELDAYPNEDRPPGYLKSGVRLDRYRKQIRAREIDRHTHDYLRSSAIGALAGAVIPASRSLKERSLVGAGVGVAAQGLLHATGHRDAYGEQSEDAKIIQRSAPKYAGAAVMAAALLKRHKGLRNALGRVVPGKI